MLFHLKERLTRENFIELPEELARSEVTLPKFASFSLPSSSIPYAVRLELVREHDIASDLILQCYRFYYNFNRMTFQCLQLAFKPSISLLFSDIALRG